MAQSWHNRGTIMVQSLQNHGTIISIIRPYEKTRENKPIETQEDWRVNGCDYGNKLKQKK